MNPSKGARREVKVRLPVALVEQLLRERDQRRDAGTMRRVDGLPFLVEEAVALRGDRDAELARSQAEAVALRAERDAYKALYAEERRQRRRDASGRRKAALGRQARAQAVLAPLGPQAAFLRDHHGPGHPSGPLPGLCPACGPPPAAQGGPPS